MDFNQAGQLSVYLKVTSVLTINALENGDFLNFIFYFLADNHKLIHTQQDVSPMSHFDSKGNVPYEAKQKDN